MQVFAQNFLQIILHSVRKAATAGIPAKVLSQERQTQSTTYCDKEEEQMQPNFERRGDFQGLVTNILLFNNVVLKNNYTILAGLPIHHFAD